jgi:hypothetical protein
MIKTMCIYCLETIRCNDDESLGKTIVKHYAICKELNKVNNVQHTNIQ